MYTFLIQFNAGSLELGGIVTATDQYRKFKVELVTKEPDPILLSRSLNDQWEVIQPGPRGFSEQDFANLEYAITEHIHGVYSVKNMLVLTDFSMAAWNASMYAAALSQQLKTSALMLYHSCESIILPPTTFAPVGQKQVEPPEKSQEELTRLKTELQQLVGQRTEIEVQNDSRALVHAANMLTEQRHVGLVVAGITGKSNLEKILIGSNTLELARKCLAPLLIVPSKAKFKPIKKIVFACDLKQVSKSVPTYAIKIFVEALGARLLILNVNHKGSDFDPDTILEMTDLHQLWDDRQVEYHYADYKDTAEGIMEFADKQAADLVITVPKIYGFFESLFHQSVTKKLAYHTHLPLVLFKEDI